MKTLWIVRGPPGSGKSTLSEALCMLGPLGYIGRFDRYEADDYFLTEEGYIFVPSHIGLAHKACKEGVEASMKSEVENIIVSNTFTQQWEIAPYRLLASNYGYTIFEVICNNDFGNVHNVPPEKVQQMHERFEYARKG